MCKISFGYWNYGKTIFNFGGDGTLESFFFIYQYFITTLYIFFLVQPFLIVKKKQDSEETKLMLEMAL